MNFDPNATGSHHHGIYGFPFTESQAKVVIIPVPWDVTTSYGQGTARGPESILMSSRQLDVCDPVFGDFYEHGIFMQPVADEWRQKNSELRVEAEKIQNKLEAGQLLTDKDRLAQEQINQGCAELNEWVKEQSLQLLAQDKIPAVVGGDHSSPLGLMMALGQHHGTFSILHIDAHMDLRESYQGFTYSHASIMRNAYEQLSIDSLIQLGIRDFCPEERDFSRMNENIITHFDGETHIDKAKGNSWYDLCRKFIEPLGSKVYISFDIDGLSPDLCPHTGTPVPGGLSFNEVGTLLYALKDSRRSIIGFDLCEVAPGDDLDCWDGNVGARVLYKLCGTVLT